MGLIKGQDIYDLTDPQTIIDEPQLDTLTGPVDIFVPGADGEPDIPLEFAEVQGKATQSPDPETFLTHQVISPDLARMLKAHEKSGGPKMNLFAVPVYAGAWFVATDAEGIGHIATAASTFEAVANMVVEERYFGFMGADLMWGLGLREEGWDPTPHLKKGTMHEKERGLIIQPRGRWG